LLESLQLILTWFPRKTWCTRERKTKRCVLLVFLGTRTEYVMLRNMYKVIRFEWETKRLADFVSRHHNFSEFLEIKSSDCIATVAEHDQIHMFRDFISKCGLGLRFVGSLEHPSLPRLGIPVLKEFS